MNLIRAGFQGLRAAVQGGYGAPRGGTSRFHGGNRDGIDMRAEAGPRVDNSIVYTAYSKATLAMREPRIVVRRPKGDGFEIVKDHPIAILLAQPVPWHSGGEMRSLHLGAEMLGGNGFSLRHRSPNGKLRGLEYLPLASCHPVSVPGSGNHIDYFQVTLGYGADRIAPENILHTKWHTPNPYGSALAIGPLESVLPQIAMDNRAARFEAALLRNGGKAHLMTPRGLDSRGNPLTFDKEQRKQFSDLMNEMATEDAAGSMAVVPWPMEVQEFGWKPSDLMLGDTHDLSEERVCAAIGAPLSWLGLGSGIESDSNRATREVVERQALLEFVLPHLARIAEQLTAALVPELGEPGDVVDFDLTSIAAYQRYLREMRIAGVSTTGGPVETVNEFRNSIGLDPIEGGDALRSAPGQPSSETKANDPL